MRLDDTLDEIGYVVLNPVQGQWEVTAVLVDATTVCARGRTVAEALAALGKALLALKVPV